MYMYVGDALFPIGTQSVTGLPSQGDNTPYYHVLSPCEAQE